MVSVENVIENINTTEIVVEVPIKSKENYEVVEV